jgi:hypothetical protein
MTKALDVEERLRHRPQGSKEQERMCADLLSLDKRFSNVHPRNPKGGPDQGRDIEAVFEGRGLAFGAVGFIDGALDTQQHRRQAGNKFQEDLNSALKHAPDLDVFVFFTNVALTAKDHDSLRDGARAIKRPLHIEIFARERIRMLLNSPKGFGLRFQYLDIEMSRAEQASFFSAHGEEIQATLTRGFTDLDLSMARLEFLADKPSPLTWLQALIHLKAPYPAADLGQFRILLELRRRGARSSVPQFTLATEDATFGQKSDRRAGIRMYVGTREHWMHNLKNPLDEEGVSQIPLGCELSPSPPIATLAQLDQHEISLWVSKPLHERIDRVSIVANVYEVADLAGPDMYFSEADEAPWWPNPEWWPELAPAAKSLEWVEITRATHLPLPEYLPDVPWLIDYYRNLPTRATL